MAAPAFVAEVEGAWETAGPLVSGRCEGVDFTAERRWWGGRWRLQSEAPFPVPEPMILYVSRRGMDHGFWRDLPVGERAFDHGHFVFCDAPALLPLVVGRATRVALSGASTSDALTLYARAGRTSVEGTNEATDREAIARHLAVHRALEEDHRASVTRWQDTVAAAHGRGEDAWPPSGTLLCRAGTLVARLRWTNPTTRDGADWGAAEASLRTDVVAHEERDGRRWSMREVGPGVAATHELAGRRFVVVGSPTIRVPAIEAAVARGDVTSISVGRRVGVAVRGLATSRQLEAAVRIVEQLLGAADATAPYR